MIRVGHVIWREDDTITYIVEVHGKVTLLDLRDDMEAVFNQAGQVLQHTVDLAENTPPGIKGPEQMA